LKSANLQESPSWAMMCYCCLLRCAPIIAVCCECRDWTATQQDKLGDRRLLALKLTQGFAISHFCGGGKAEESLLLFGQVRHITSYHQQPEGHDQTLRAIAGLQYSPCCHNFAKKGAQLAPVDNLSAVIGRSDILPEGKEQSISTEVTPTRQIRCQSVGIEPSRWHLISNHVGGT
jgi:hypothetical protein